MKKESTHDYTMAAFSLYAECGCPSNEELYERLYRDAKRSHEAVGQRNKRRSRRKLTEEDMIEVKFRQLGEELKPYIMDIEAVNAMLEEIAASPLGEDKLKCIKYICFDSSAALNQRGNRSAIIQRCVVDTGLNESFIYRSLREARELFVIKRGLSGNLPEQLLSVIKSGAAEQ